MVTIKVTELEKQVLEALAGNTYAELGYSDVGFPELREGTGKDNKVLRGVVSSLVKKGLVEVDEREDEGYGNNTDMHIIYLTHLTQGLVPHWVEEEKLVPVQLIVG